LRENSDIFVELQSKRREMIPALFLHNNDTTRNDSCTSPPISFEVKKKKKIEKTK
jgi:hypothetical protein